MFESHNLRVKKSKLYEIKKDISVIDLHSAMALFHFEGISYHHLVNGLIKKTNFHQLYDYSPELKFFWINLNHIIFELGLSFQIFCEASEISYKKLSYYRSRGTSPPLSSILKVEVFFKTSLYSLFNPNLDLDSVIENVKENQKSFYYIPARYTAGDGSYMRVFENAIEFIDSTYGGETVSELLKSMGIDKRSLCFSEKKISITIFKDLHNKLRSFGAVDEYFINMGRYNPTRNRKVISDLKQKGTSQNHYEYFLNCSQTHAWRVDQNFDYEFLSISHDTCICLSRPRVEMQKKLGVKNIGSYEVALYRYGHALTAPMYHGLEEIKQDLSFFDYDDISGEVRMEFKY